MQDHSSKSTSSETSPSGTLSKDALFGAAVLKLSFMLKDKLNTPGFTFVYNGTLRDLGVTNSQVDRYIEQHRAALIAHIEKSGGK